MKTINLLILCFLLSACASIISPDGGEKDINPPTVLKTIPDSACTSCKPKTLTLEFDEFIQVQNANTEWFINPQTTKNITHKVINKKLIISGLDSLSENKTYTLSFQNSITDINESNPLSNYRFTFSTGPFIDTCHFQGKIISSATGLPEKNISIIAYNQDDKYLSISDDSGNYHFQNMAASIYSFFAFDDKNKNRLDDPDERYGFITTQNVGCYQNLDPITIFNNVSGPQEIISISSPASGIFLLKLKHPSYYYPVQISYQNKQATPIADDTFQLVLNQFPDTLTFDFQTDDTSYLVKYTTPIFQDSLFITDIKTGNPTILSLNKNIVNLDTTKISILDQPEKISIQKDGNRLIIYNNGPTDIHICLLDAFLEFPNNKKSPAYKDTIICKAKTSPDVNNTGKGSLHFRLDSLAKPLFVELMRQNQLIQTVYIKQRGTFEFNDLEPGVYSLRIKEDSNENGFYDRGNKLLKSLPEPIKVLNKEFKVKANWIQRDLIIQ